MKALGASPMMSSHRPVLAVLVAAASCLAAARIAAQALPDSVLLAVRAGVSSVALKSDSIAVPLVGTPMLPLVEVRVNGQGPFRFLVDLGANVSLLRRSVVDSARVRVLVERASSDIVRAESLRIGALQLRDVTLASYDDLDVDGVIGFNLLQHFSFTLDFPARVLSFHNRTLPAPNGHRVIGYRLEGRMPYVAALIGRDTLWLNLDTGAAEVMTIPPRLQSRFHWLVTPTPGRMTFNNQTGRTQVLEGQLRDTVVLGPLTVPSPRVFVNPDADDAWFGSAAMIRARWTFDPRNKRLLVELP